MKIPRRTLFVAQLVACILGTLTQSEFHTREFPTHLLTPFLPDGVLIWMLGNVKDVCSSDQPDNFTCPQGRVNYNSAIFWGGMSCQFPVSSHGLTRLISDWARATI